MYREAMEVGWDPARRSLFSPPPREWSYGRWLQQILAAAREQGCELVVDVRTQWVNIDPSLKIELLKTADA
jgi:hypothetical protein